MNTTRLPACCCASYNLLALFNNHSASENSASALGHPKQHRQESKTRLQTYGSDFSPLSDSNLDYTVESVGNCPQTETQADSNHELYLSETAQHLIFVLNQQIHSVFDPNNSPISHSSILPCPLSSSIRNWTYVSLFELQGTILTGGTIDHCSKGGACLWLEHASGRLVVLSSLSHFRHFHGIVYVQGRVYVFGGEWIPNQHLNCAESLYVHGRLESSPWTYIPNPMVQPRSHINPCVHKDLVYLASGGHPSIEVFYPLDQCFRPLDLQLLDQRGCIMVADEDKLVIITSAFLYKVNLGTIETEVVKHQPYCVQVNSPALLYGGCVYAARDGKLISIDVATGALRDEDLCR